MALNDPDAPINLPLHLDACGWCNTRNHRPHTLLLRKHGYLAVYDCPCGQSWMTDWYVPEVV